MSDFTERRKYPRVSVQIPAGIYFKNDPHSCIDAEILDLSLGGAFVHCTAPIKIGEEVIIEIRFDNSTLLSAKVIITNDGADDEALQFLPTQGIVRWARGSAESGFGVAFTGLSKEKEEYLKKLVRHFDALMKSGVTLPNR